MDAWDRSGLEDFSAEKDDNNLTSGNTQKDCAKEKVFADILKDVESAIQATTAKQS